VPVDTLSNNVDKSTLKAPHNTIQSDPNQEQLYVVSLRIPLKVFTAVAKSRHTIQGPERPDASRVLRVGRVTVPIRRVVWFSWYCPAEVGAV
jgi:hypothetical protein